MTLLAEQLLGVNIGEQFNKALEAERQGYVATKQAEANAITAKAQGEATAISKGFSTETGLFGSKTQAGSPASGLAQNQGWNFLDILKYNATNAPSTLQESGKEKSMVFVVSTPQGESQVTTSPSGSTITQKNQDTSGTSYSSWLPIIIVVGVIIIAIVIIRK